MIYLGNLYKIIMKIGLTELRYNVQRFIKVFVNVHVIIFILSCFL